MTPYKNEKQKDKVNDSLVRISNYDPITESINVYVNWWTDKKTVNIQLTDIPKKLHEHVKKCGELLMDITLVIPKEYDKECYLKFENIRSFNK